VLEVTAQMATPGAESAVCSCLVQSCIFGASFSGRDDGRRVTACVSSSSRVDRQSGRLSGHDDGLIMNVRHLSPPSPGGSVAEWLARRRARVQIAVATLSGNSLRQTVKFTPIVPLSVHQAAKLVAALLRVARVTAGLAESNGSLASGL